MQMLASQIEEGYGARKVVVIDDQIGRAGPFRETFLAGAGLPAADFLFMTGQDDGGRNSIGTVVEYVDSLWAGAGAVGPSLVLLDVQFDDQEDADPEKFGFRLLDALREKCGPTLPIVMLTNIADARPAANEGRADGFLPKSELSPEVLEQQLFRNGLYPSSRMGPQGTSTAFLLTLREIRRAVGSGVMELLLLGETGSGKSELARYAHAESPRRHGPFETWFPRRSNADLHYDQLFGHWKGAFSGADRNVAGVAERAHRGTLLVDEIAELSPDGQTELLEYRDRHRRDGLRRVRRLGLYPGAASKSLHLVGDYSADEDRILVDTFLVTATNQPIQDASWREARAFRQDLYNRLGHRIEVPPLRSRPADIGPLFRHFLERAARRPIDLAPAALDRLMTHRWTDGNLAELKTVADEVCMRLGPDFDQVLLHHLDDLLFGPAGASTPDAPPTGNNNTSERAFVDFEVESLWGLAERLRTAVVEARTPRGMGSLADILKYATGVAYAPTDVKREVKDILAAWFAPNDRRAARWRAHPVYRERARRVQDDVVLATLYRYSAGQIPWGEARVRVGEALSERPRRVGE